MDLELETGFERVGDFVPGELDGGVGEELAVGGKGVSSWFCVGLRVKMVNEDRRKRREVV